MKNLKFNITEALAQAANAFAFCIANPLDKPYMTIQRIDDPEGDVPFLVGGDDAAAKLAKELFGIQTELVDECHYKITKIKSNFIQTIPYKTAKEFIDTWGQSQEEICVELDLDDDSDDFDDIILEDYFWLPDYQTWLPKASSMYSSMEAVCAEFLYNKV
jgi:hypothetical protein